MKKVTLLVAVLLVVLLVGPSPASAIGTSDSPIPSPTPVSSATPVPSSTPTPSPTLTPTPSPTLTPTPSPIEPPLPGIGGTEVLRELLMLLIGGGLAAVIVLWFLDAPIGVALAEWLFRVAAWMRLGIELPEVRRGASIVLTAMVSLLAYLAAMAFGFVDNPGGVAEWLNLILALMGAGYPGNQMLHALVRRFTVSNGS